MIVKYIFLSMRPEQWIKNFFVFTALLFSKNLLNLSKDIDALVGFIIFCMITGCSYIINDLVDLEKDKLHPTKSQRPIASGRLNKTTAIKITTIICLVSLSFAFYINSFFGIIVLTYFLLNIGYSIYLKNIVIIDVVTIASGFVLRVLGGAVIISVTSSQWLVLCTILLSLFLGFSKRRHELILLEDNATGHRKVLEHYSPYFLDQMISVVTASTLICYALYTMSKDTIEKLGTSKLIYTIPFVLYGIFRYLYLVHQKEKGGSPTEVVFTDKPMIINISLWVIASVMFIYIVH
ncbi:MAG: phosphoribose diphosphate--decaprenyl-phosphate phosphoribosyltransferase [Planctomycetes bacterium RIFCSPLOWO2_12_FULL_39_13]|nr:MAG: phosphoribose diphosphate--decaprenyl-phosphate phosphoribosyltransferase [Planctomycetes bacterium GWA2_39_15]OHB99859.1 MAG: phosphoribose diphosphate--decaprenyl-phosphate phosphoribosyltransferase [Planctomycetes bacterium RIFCSPLOWO2_12_FULL_39_13]